ncbi:hypothetical protein CCR75_002901 [Bremia lactucae]|uniref:Uncharacterized protein n=1 Tax=Bremia lactucae TaxID=4779 RepID=A0A976FP29_BRELC|nr:hypothetical protein CCR75_002901 [Bremia lactucae]
MDRKRGHESSPEQAETGKADASHKRNTTDFFKRGRAEPMPMPMLANDESCDRIDQDDWAASWEQLEPEGPIHSNWIFLPPTAPL